MAGVATDPNVQILIDVSHWKTGVSPSRVEVEGIDGLIAKATDPQLANGVDPTFKSYMDACHEADLPFACFIYQQGRSSAASQVALAVKHIPKDVPVIPDVEAGSGSIALTRELVNRLRDAGYVVPWSYVPRWYWQQQGSPSLAGLPPLWSSRYPDTQAGSLQAEWQDIPASYWQGYGGLPVGLLQFTSSGRLASYPYVLDMSGFRGTRAQLLNTLNGRGLMSSSIEQSSLDLIAHAVADYETDAVYELMDGTRKKLDMHGLAEEALKTSVATWRRVDAYLKAGVQDDIAVDRANAQELTALRAEVSTQGQLLQQILAKVSESA